MKTGTFEIQDLDVLGNEEEGWEVNATYRIGTMELSLVQWEDDDYLLNELVTLGLLLPKAKELVEIDSIGEREVTIVRKDNGKPLYTIQYKN